MRDPVWWLGSALALLVVSGTADVVVRSFDRDPVGDVPAGLTFAAARLPNPGRWLTRADGDNRYLAHLGDRSVGEGFALALFDSASPGDLRLSARIRLADGARVGGLVWRYRSPDSFYAVSLDLNAQEVALYRITRGNRVRLEFEDDLELDVNAWHVVRVEHSDGRIRVALGGIGVMRARSGDDTGEPGRRAGVWSSGTTTAWFDDLSVQPASARDR